MVSTRRKAAPTAADEAPQPPPPRAASPRRPRRAAAATPAVDAAGTATEEDAKWAAHYRDLVRREKEAAGRNAITRVATVTRRTWHHYRTSMGPFMMDPWEQVLYLCGIFLLFLAASHAVGRLVDMAWPVLAGWVAAIKPLLNSS